MGTIRSRDGLCGAQGCIPRQERVKGNPGLASELLDGAREAKRLRPSIPVVCCTGFGDARAERTAAEIGVSAFIRKPIDFDHYAKTIRAAIDGSRRG